MSALLPPPSETISPCLKRQRKQYDTSLPPPPSHPPFILILACRQLTEQLEDTSEVPTDMCPLLSFSTLSTVSEGKPEQKPKPSSRDIPVATLGYPAKDLGADFMLKNSQIA
jgi:hypothetical protein